MINNSLVVLPRFWTKCFRIEMERTLCKPPQHATTEMWRVEAELLALRRRSDDHATRARSQGQQVSEGRRKSYSILIWKFIFSIIRTESFSNLKNTLQRKGGISRKNYNDGLRCIRDIQNELMLLKPSIGRNCCQGSWQVIKLKLHKCNVSH